MAGRKKRNYPWIILDLDKTSDQTLIRKAYATRLRVTRPEDDAEAFQVLVEARDFALALAASSSLKPKKRKPTKRGPARKKKPANVADKSVAFDPAKNGSEGLPSSNARKSAPSHPAAQAANLGSVTDDIGYFLDSKHTNLDPVRARAALDAVSAMSISEKAEIEQDLLEIVARSLPLALHNTQNQRGGDRQRGRAMAWLINALDDEFRWTENDRRVQDMTYHINELTADQLYELLQKRPPALPPLPPAYSSPWYINIVGALALLWVLYHALRTLF